MAAAKLKIGLVIDTDLDATDGVQQYVLTLGRWLTDQGHAVRYLTGGTHRTDLAGLYNLARNISVPFNGNRQTIPLPASRRRIKAILKIESFDILHVQTPHSPFLAQKIMLAADDRTVVFGTFHILPLGRASRIGNRLLAIWLRPSIKRFDEVVSVSSAAAAFARQSFGITTEVVPNMIDLKPFQTAKRLDKYPRDKLTILFLGRLVPRKGCLTLLQAIARLKNSGDMAPCRVIVCGKGSEESKLRQYVRNNGLDGLVEFAGYVSEPDKPRYFASADIAVFPSLGGESFGIVLLEAMASGKAAVMAADNAGYRSVVTKPELLFDPTNADALADKLNLLMRNSVERQRVSQWGKREVLQYDIDVVGRQLLARYDQALRLRRAT